MTALEEIFKDEKNTFGSEKITYLEMIHYAFGKGHVYDLIWDNERDVMISSL